MPTLSKTLPEKRWLIHPQNEALSMKLGQVLGVPQEISQLLLNRNIRSVKQAKEFLSPDDIKSANFDESDLNTCATLIQRHIDSNHAIVIYGDYDVDGMTSTSMMVTVLEALGAKTTYYIPNRFTEGYGLNTSIIPVIQQKKASLLITLDCGISNKKEIEAIKANTGVDVIILDHHNIPDDCPDAEAILNPKYYAKDHPIYGLCTAGIVYKLSEYLVSYFKSEFPLESLIDIAAIGTIADIAHVSGVNRYIIQKGLNQLRYTRHAGLKALLEVSGQEKRQYSTRDVGFTIAPRLNASGRLGVAKKGVELLLSKSHDDALTHAQSLETMNEKRRYIGEEMLQECIPVIEKNEKLMQSPVLIVAGKNWHSGVIGITAARLTDKYSKPTVIIAYDDDLGRGSARSVGEFDLYHFLKPFSPLFESFGGHKEAAGFSIKPENIPLFIQQAVDAAIKDVDPKKNVPLIDIDSDLDAKNLTLEFAKNLSIMAPFGPKNPQPVFYSNTLNPIDMRCVGGGSHLKVTFQDKHTDLVIDAIGFGLGHKIDLLYKHQVEVAFSLDINEWQGKEQPQLNLIDIK